MPGRVLAMSSSPASDAVASSSMHRTSGRVRRQPETLYDSTLPAGAKRKRNEIASTHDDVEMPEDYVSDEDLPSEDDEPDEEELREKRARARKNKAAASSTKKPPQKRAKVNGTTNLPIRATGGPRKRASKAGKTINTLDAEEAGGIFADVFAHARDYQEIMQDWRHSFAEHESSALADVIKFVLRSAGCKGSVTDHDVEDPDAVTGKIMDLQEEFQASNPTDYPLMGKSANTFKQGVTGFLEVFVKSIAETGLLYENPELIENIQVWFSTMSSAANRPFRHTATVVSLCIMDALCDVTRGLADEVARTRRHAESEKKKARPNKQRIAEIENKAKDSADMLEHVEVLLKDWFDVIFIHRYRDIDATIRRECSAALGGWIITMPSTFFDGTHLRYLGWMLSDTSPAVRGEVLKQLTRIYKSPDMLGGAKTFTERFRSRMVEMATSDAETSVRSSAVELLDLLREHGLLEPDDVDTIGGLIFDSDTKVRKAVARFLGESVQEMYTSKLDDLGGQETLEEALPEADEESYESPRLDWLKLKCLAEILQAYDNDESLPSQIERSHPGGGLTYLAAGTDSRFTLAAETLFNTIAELQDWRILSGYLLFDHSSGRTNGAGDDPLAQLKHEAILSENEETVLLEVLNASVKRSLSDNADKIISTKTKLGKRERETLQDEQEDAARDLASAIPKLLEKFGDSPDTASAVLRLEAIFGLPSLQDLQQDSASYSALLDDIRKQFMSHSSDKVLGPASNAILHAKSYGELDELTDEKVAGLWDDVVRNLLDLITAANVSIRGVQTFEELTALTNNLLRIMRLAAVSDCSGPLEDESLVTGSSKNEDLKAPIDFVLALVRRAIPAEDGIALDADEAVLEDQISSRAAEAALFYFRWKLKSIIERATSSSGGDIPYEELEALATRRDRYGDLLEAVLAARKPTDGVCIAIAGFLLDLYSSAAALKTVKARPGVSDDYTVLILELMEEMERAVFKIFNVAEKNFARLSGKKLDEAHATTADSNGDLDVDDPLNEDPISDPESDDEEDEHTHTQNQATTQASQTRRETNLLNTLLAEQRLCEFAGKMIFAALGGVMDLERVRKRLERNRARLGPNFKEVCAFLDAEAVAGRHGGRKTRAAKPKTAAKGKGGEKGLGKKSAKSNALVLEDEEDDEIEEDDEDEVEEEDQAALRRRGLVAEGEEEAEVEVDEGAEEPESVLGD